MRSHTNADLTGRCHACHQRLEICPCAVLPRLRTRTRIVVIRHALETLKTTNTARLASLMLPNFSIVSWGGIDDHASDAFAAIPERGAILLYPVGPEAAAAALVSPWTVPVVRAAPDGASSSSADDAPLTLVVPDGNWNQSKKMVRRLLRARPLPFWPLDDAPARNTKRLRTPVQEGHRSTLEAIAAALGRLESPAVETSLLAAYDDFVARITSTSGRLRERDRAAR